MSGAVLLPALRLNSTARRSFCLSSGGAGGGPRMVKLTLFSPTNRVFPASPHGTSRKRNTAGQSRRGNAPFVPRLRDERDRRTRASRRARWLEACAPPDPVRNVRGEHRSEERRVGKEC